MNLKGPFYALGLALLLLLTTAGALAQCDCGTNENTTTYGNISIRAELIQYRDASAPDLNVFLNVKDGVAANLEGCKLVIITDDRKIETPLDGTIFPCNEREVTVNYGNEMIGNTINSPDGVKIIDSRGKPIAITCLGPENLKTMLKP